MCNRRAGLWNFTTSLSDDVDLPQIYHKRSHHPIDSNNSSILIDSSTEIIRDPIPKRQKFDGISYHSALFCDPSIHPLNRSIFSQTLSRSVLSNPVPYKPHITFDANELNGSLQWATSLNQSLQYVSSSIYDNNENIKLSDEKHYDNPLSMVCNRGKRNSESINVNINNSKKVRNVRAKLNELSVDTNNILCTSHISKKRSLKFDEDLNSSKKTKLNDNAFVLSFGHKKRNRIDDFEFQRSTKKIKSSCQLKSFDPIREHRHLCPWINNIHLPHSNQK